MRADLEQTFSGWLEWSRDDEIFALLDLVREALERRGYTVECAVSRQIRGEEKGRAG